MTVVYIGLGSNLGVREDQVGAAVAFLSARGIAVTKQSSLYETEPWGVADQPAFINMVIEIDTDKEPAELLALLKEGERLLGRVDGPRWGPRAIDLDILLFSDRIIQEPDLTIPHPRMHERKFVLEPLTEIAPLALHPLLGKTAAELLSLNTEEHLQ